MNFPSAALRRISSVTLALAFVALATSGLLMFVVDRFGFQVRMHPIHNAFGIVMVIAGVPHVAFNWKALVAHLRPRWSTILGALLAGVMALLLVDGLTMKVDAEAARKIDDFLSATRQAEHAD